MADQEIWKVYPGYSFVEVSNLGNVRTKDRYATCRNGGRRLVRGHILKQYQNQDGYLFVHFSINGKHVQLLVHRMVAITFIPNPHEYPEINHLDNNPKNNVVFNLEWCSHAYNITYREKIGVPAKKYTKVLRKSVFAVDLETGKVFYFESQSEAARQLGIAQQDICAVINGRIELAGGYWFTEDKSEITKEKIQEIKDKMQSCSCPVIAINPDTSEVFLFKSRREAGRQLGVYAQHISMVVKGGTNMAKNYYFYNADKNAVEKTRDKFGDEVADKVGKLIREH